MTDTVSAERSGSLTAMVRRVSLGPVSRESILAMARLTGDFHPFRTLEPVARASGRQQLALHAGWISGLVDAGIRTTLVPWSISTLCIHYEEAASERDVLSLEFTVDSSLDAEAERRLSFEVKNQRGRRLAHGTAVVRLSSRDYGEESK
jgi:hypothetical protein